MGEEMTVSQLVATLKRERAAWGEMLARVPDERAAEPGVAGDWSLQDLIAHVTWAERETVGMLTARALVGSMDLWAMPQDDRNAAVYEQNRDRVLDEVRAEAQDVFTQLVEQVEKLSDEDLLDVSRFEGWMPDWVPWKVIAANSYEHYRAHMKDVRAWAEGKAE